MNGFSGQITLTKTGEMVTQCVGRMEISGQIQQSDSDFSGTILTIRMGFAQAIG
jgi:hypothetical protein